MILCNAYTVPGPVSSLLVIPLSSNALFMRWSEPDHKNGIILGYNVIVGSLEAFVDNDARFLEVNNLGKLYTAMLICFENM